MHKKLLL